MPPRRRGPEIMVLAALLTTGCAAGAGGPLPEESASSPPAGSSRVPSPLPTAGARQLPLADLELDRVTLDSPDWLATTPGALWVKLDGGTVVRVDPRTAEVVARVKATGPQEFSLCQGFGSSPDAVWTCTPYGTLAQIDPRTDKVVSDAPSQARADQGHYVVADDRLWMMSGESPTTMIGLPVSGSGETRSIELGAQCTELALQGTQVIWAACPTESQLLRVDLATGEATGRVALDEPRVVAVGDRVFASTKTGVAQVDSSTLAVEAVYAVHAGLGGGIWADADAVWVRCDRGPFLVGIDPRARRVTTVVVADDLPSGGNVLRVDDDLWATAYDDSALVRLTLPT